MNKNSRGWCTPACNVFYWNNCWFTNVGEAFIDIGAMHLIRELYARCGRQVRVVNLSDMSAHYIGKLKKGKQAPRMLSMESILPVGRGDFVYFAGMLMADTWLRNANHPFRSTLKRFAAKGARIVFLGVGQEHYTREEARLFLDFLEELDVPLIVTRDRISYENIKDWDSGVVISGLDCAFWVKDVYNPSLGRKGGQYDVATYNRSVEPAVFGRWEKKLVRAWHMQDSAMPWIVKDNQLLSDTPYDYLTLYANADKVYTDLVHASCIALQYGKFVKFSPVDGRQSVITALEGLQRDEEGFLYITNEALEAQKERLMEEISSQLRKCVI